MRIRVRNNIAELLDRNFVLVLNNTEYQIEFEFSEEWQQSQAKTAVFITDGAEPIEVAFIGNTVTVPEIANTFRLAVGVYAGDLRTTTPAMIKCLPSILTGTELDHIPEGVDIYNQIMTLINQLPTTPLPREDLAEDVQESLDKADTALQEHQSLSAYRTASAQDEIDNTKQPLIDENNKLPYDLLSDTPEIPSIEGLASKEYVDETANGLQEQIDAIVSASDVVDIVGTYTELLAYDTSKLSDNDVIKVLDDSVHSNKRSYYRWIITNGVGTWNYVGSEADSYTKAETNTLLQGKQDNITEQNKLPISKISGAVSYNEQTLTEAEKSQARHNIDAAGVEGYFQGIRSGRADNLVTDIGSIIDAQATEQSGDVFPDKPNNAKGTGTFYPYGENDWVTVEKDTAETIEKVYGHSYNKNQLVANSNFEDASMWSLMYEGTTGLSIADGVATITQTAPEGHYLINSAWSLLPANHKIFWEIDYDTTEITSGDAYCFVGGVEIGRGWRDKAVRRGIITSIQGQANYSSLALFGWFKGTVKVYSVRVVDLTVLDQQLASTAGLTPQAVLKVYPDIPTWEYTETPQMIDAEDFTYSSSGINSFNGDFTAYHFCLPAKTYYALTTNALTIEFYDKDKTLISSVSSVQNSTFTTPTNCFFYKVVGSGSNIQICLHYTDTELENTYHPHVAPATKEIHFYGGKGRSAGTVCDEVDFVAKKRRKKVGTVDLGTLNWSYVTTDTQPYYFKASLPARSYSTTNFSNGICSKYPFINVAGTRNLVDKSMVFATGNNSVFIADSGYTDATTFKSAMSGVILNYELAEPIEEDLPEAEQNNILPCNDYGIESKSDGVVCGMRVQYQANPKRTIFNNKAAIEQLKALVGSNEQIKATLNAIGFYELPEIQTTGTYALNTINGVLTWVAEGE